MKELEKTYRKKYDEALEKAAENPENETFRPILALDAILKEIEKNGFMQIIDLDPYFGEFSFPLKEQTDLLIQRYPETFSFFEAFIKDLQEEIELFFEVTEMYEDEEFDQFVEDMKIIKTRYGEMFENEYKEKMNDFIKHVLDDLT